MKAGLIDGAALAKAQCDALALDIERLKAKGIIPGLTVILAGDDPASEIYVRNKQKKAASLGIRSNVMRFSSDVTQAELEGAIQKLNADMSVHGILVQLPLPYGINERVLADLILPHKDVDGLNSINMGRLLSGFGGVIPCTPRGIVELIKSTGTSIEGAHAVVIGRSNIVGRPIAVLLEKHNATVTLCHSRTKDLSEHTRRADILIVAVGKAGLIKKDMVKPGAVVIDVGMNRQESGLCGDVAFDEVGDVAGYITPVPRGVGPMTIAMLMKNTVEAAALMLKD